MKLKKKKLKEAPKVPSYDEALEVSMKRFNALQVKVPARPKDKNGDPLDPVLPADLTALNDLKLGRLFSEFATMAQYAQFSLARRAMEHAAKKRAEKLIRAKVKLVQSGTVVDKDCKTELHPNVRRASVETFQGEATEELTRAILESYLIGRDAISREMTRRQWTTNRDPSAGR